MNNVSRPLLIVLAVVLIIVALAMGLAVTHEHGGLNGTLTLFDCGIATDLARAALKKGFEDRGLDRAKITAIIISPTMIWLLVRRQVRGFTAPCSRWPRRARPARSTGVRPRSPAR